MAAMDDTSIFGMDQGCPIHGDDFMKECSMCGAEFCRLCHPKATVCPDCAAEEDEELDEEELEDADFDDVENLDDILESDEDEEDEDDAEKDE
jgi:hypothetical protein